MVSAKKVTGEKAVKMSIPFGGHRASRENQTTKQYKKGKLLYVIQRPYKNFDEFVYEVQTGHGRKGTQHTHIGLPFRPHLAHAF